ncbi:interleukin-10 [Cyprinid herpesvirus 3]|uniref:Uncharacterized protein n=1 Tax=Cyprinid herpesvirus 3 TaxID=180230 RepID=A4FTM8_CYHV3|nr:interleukin-10 [Cyprinid herpesvirus 3]BAF48947.1 hypothetical protein [Cyprinid herpesvirus 3]
MFLAVLLTATIFFEARGAPATTPKDSCVYLIGQTPQLLRQLRNAYQAIIGADGSGVDEDDMPIYPSDVMNELASTSVACDAIKKVLTMNIGILPNVTAAYPDKKSEVDEIGDNLSRLHQNIVNCVSRTQHLCYD